MSRRQIQKILPGSLGRGRICVVVVNWNNWRDTEECLTAIITSKADNLDIVLVDNGSEEDYFTAVESWTKKYAVSYVSVLDISSPISQHDSAQRTLFLLKLKENVGFACGSNQGIKFALRYNYEWILLLNNDAIVEPNTIEELLAACIQDGILVCTPRIFYYDRKSELWNAGGKLTWYGSRKYFTSRAYAIWPHNVRRVRKITFITGCALFAHRTIYENLGLLSEKFFFGEEDYEFSQRLRKRGIAMYCIDSAIVYHKVGRSSQSLGYDQLIRVLHYYLNRLVNMKSYYPHLLWHLWRVIVMANLFIRLRKMRLSWSKCWYLVHKVGSHARYLGQVGKNEINMLRSDVDALE